MSAALHEDHDRPGDRDRHAEADPSERTAVDRSRSEDAGRAGPDGADRPRAADPGPGDESDPVIRAGVWTLTAGRLIVLYVAATLFGANLALAVGGSVGVSPVGAAAGAIAMSLLSIIVLTVSYRPASDAGRRSEPPDRG